MSEWRALLLYLRQDDIVTCAQAGAEYLECLKAPKDELVRVPQGQGACKAERHWAQRTDASNAPK